MTLSYAIRQSCIGSKIRSMVFCLATLVGVVMFFSISPYVAAEPLSPPTQAPIVVNIDKGAYSRGDIMVISGKVESVVASVPLTVQILDPETDLIHVEQVSVASDGRFSQTIRTDGPLWRLPGTYSMVVQYGFKHVSAMINFEFEQTNIPTSGSFNVKDISSGQNFDLNYTITGGQVKSIIVDPQDIALVAQVDVKSSGVLHLQIPRLLLDAKKPSNADEPFLVFVDDNEIASFQESNSSYQYRVLDIPVVNGDSKIEIIGTTAIPEFENVSSLVLVLAVVLVISFTILSKTKMSTKSLKL